MKKNTTLVRESKPSVKLTEHQQNLLKRINNLAISLMPEFEDRICLRAWGQSRRLPWMIVL